MSNYPESTDPEQWHRYFAIVGNNRAWDLSVQTRSEKEDQEMLNAAHASAYHWLVAGDQLNRMRATMLLAEVHALLGHGSTALELANEMHAFFLANNCPDWELAFVHTIHAHAAHVAGDLPAYGSSYHAAKLALEAIADPEDRAIVQATFDHVPVS